jgi:molybdenum cofactor cytidylyltransferase
VRPGRRHRDGRGGGAAGTEAAAPGAGADPEGGVDRADDVVAVILAAGSARRFGGGKVLAPLDGRSLLGHVVETAARAGLRATVVVPPDPEVETAARTAGAATVTNPDPDRGLASSLAAGLGALPPRAVAAVVLLADQPTLPADTVAAVVAAWRTDPDRPWRARYDDGAGHPVVLPGRTWAAVTAGGGDRGARDALSDLDVGEVRIAGPRPPDVDRREDLEHLRARASGRAPGPAQIGGAPGRRRSGPSEGAAGLP